VAGGGGIAQENNQGHLTITPPGDGPTWTQGAGMHAGGGEVHSQYHSRHVNTNTFFAGENTYLHACGRGWTDNRFYANITASGNLSLGNVGLFGPMVINVGENFRIGGSTGVCHHCNTTVNSCANSVMNVTGNVVVNVGTNATVTIGNTVRTVPAGGLVLTSADTNISGTGTITVIRNEAAVTAATNLDADPYDVWPAPTNNRNLTLSWRFADNDQRDDPNAISNLQSRYGIAVVPNAGQSWTGTKQCVYYIDGSGQGPGSNIALTMGAAGSSDANHSAANNRLFVLIDTGLGANARTVNITLRGNAGGGTSGTFCWKQTGGQRIYVLTLGDGDAIFHVPNGVTYRQGTGASPQVVVMPFNLAIERNPNVSIAGSGNDSWHNCTRLTYFGAEGSSQTNLCANPRTCSAAMGLNEMGCFLLSLLSASADHPNDPLSNSGRLRTDLTTRSPAERRIRQNNHRNPLNLNVFLVYNGVSSDGGGLQMGTAGFFAGTIYTPFRNLNFIQAQGGGGVGGLASILSNHAQPTEREQIVFTLPGGGVGSQATPSTPGLAVDPPGGVTGPPTNFPTPQDPGNGALPPTVVPPTRPEIENEPSTIPGTQPGGMSGPQPQWIQAPDGSPPRPPSERDGDIDLRNIMNGDWIRR
jgi:hypothetical protein